MLRKWYRNQPTWLRNAVVAVASIASIALILVGAIVALAAWEMSLRQLCGSNGSYSQVSPDGRYRAVLYEYDCGATTDFGTNLAILPASGKFDPFAVPDSQRVFTANSNHQAVGVDMNGILPVTIAWKGAQDLQVTIPRMAKVFNQKTRSGPVTIEYLPVD